MAKRSKADAEKTRARLIEVAMHLFGTRGYADTSIADICDELDITKGALFHHFKTKVVDFLTNPRWTDEDFVFCRGHPCLDPPEEFFCSQ